MKLSSHHCGPHHSATKRAFRDAPTPISPTPFLSKISACPPELFHDGGCDHVETSPWTGFYIITVSVMKELIRFFILPGPLACNLESVQIHINQQFLGLQSQE